MPLSQKQSETTGLRILSLDGDGVGVLGELTVIRELMYRIQNNLGLDTTPLPCDWFQLIGGTGTGGLIAILLGRLRLSVDEATRCYLDIMGRVYDRKQAKPHDRAAELERVLRTLVEKYYNDHDKPMIVASDNASACKVVVYAMATACIQPGAPTCIRSYRVPENQGPECSIVEAIRITTATPGVIKRKVIYDGDIEASYIGAGMGCNNPTAQLLVEAGRAYPGRLTACVVSIGAGQHHHIRIQEPKGLLDSVSAQIAAAAEAIAKDCERTHEEVAVRFSHTTNLYFRFNLEQGNQDVHQYDTSRLSDTHAHTKAYLAGALISARLNDAVTAVMNGKESAMLLNGNVALISQNQVSIGRCPAPTPAFTGREDLLEKLRAYFFNQSNQRHLFVLYGLGGSGKTQLALMFVQRHKKMFWDVFYIDATTHETIKSGLSQIGKKANVDATYEAALEWLVAQEERWLIVYNNANDPAIDLSDYFPSCAHGDILITTRNRDMTVHAPGPDSHSRVGDMKRKDALALLFKTSGVTVSPKSRAEASLLVDRLGFLTLAIVQAGAYIHSTQCTLNGYLDLFETARERLLRTRRVSQTDGYKLTAYATWDVSYQNPLLLRGAAQLLGVMSFMHHDEIPAHFFETAAIKITQYQPVIPLDKQETTMRDAAAEFLGSLTTPRKTWDTLGWQELTNNLRSFSLLDYDPIGQTYSMHPLVHSWCRGVLSDPDSVRECAAWVLALCVDRDSKSKEHCFRQLLPHLLSLLGSDVLISPTLAMDLCDVLGLGFMFRRQAPLLEHPLQASKERLGGDHRQTLQCMEKLASSYRFHFQFEKAEAMTVELLGIQKRLLGDDHPTVLSLIRKLASIHKGPERQAESKPLLTDVLATQKRVLGPEHPDVCKTMDDLALECKRLGHWTEAEELKVQVLQIRSRTLGSEHPTVLINTLELSTIYHNLDRPAEAESLTILVLETVKRILGEQFDEMIPYIAIMALAYHLDDRLAEAELLQVEALEASKKMLGPSNPATLILGYDLSITYFAQGRTEEYEKLKAETSEYISYPIDKPDFDTTTGERIRGGFTGGWEFRRFLRAWLALTHSDATKRLMKGRRGERDSFIAKISVGFLGNCDNLFDAPAPPLDIGGIADMMSIFGDPDDVEMDDDELDEAEADFRSFVESQNGCPVM